LPFAPSEGRKGGSLVEIIGGVVVRRITKQVNVGELIIGGSAPISVQSMANTDTRDIKTTVEQIKRLESFGCEIIRIAIPDMQAAEAVKEIKKQIGIPLIADIHFDYRLAIASIENGADKIRINPGNIGDIDRIRQVVDKAKERNIPLRVGVNSGSLEKEILNKYDGVTVDGLVESALRNVKIVEDLGWDKIVISLKASNVQNTIKAYRQICEKTDYPLHIGVTEAGTVFRGTIRSAIGIGTLLAEGIGDTLRVSLTGDPAEEVKVGIEILKSLELRKQGVNIVSCPTCGRCRVNLVDIANKIEQGLVDIKQDIKVAVMGCAVNGQGEAKDADVGVACGDGCGLIFKNGEIVRKVPEENIVEELLKEVRNGESKYVY
jgi:(E)-4-hydroxy-3-methylbut-2-enyl-diphosphate synthase